MTHKNTNPIFDPIPGNDLNLHTGLEGEDVISGKTSKRIHKDVFGDLNDEGLFDDIFGVPKKRFDDITLKNKKKR